MAVVRVATCQFPVSDDVQSNLRHVLRQARSAKHQGAHVAHFPEGALSGYAGTDFDTFVGFGWDGLADATDQVLEAARELRMWLVVGSAHRLSDGHKPHNSLYVINDAGEIVDRYDKRFCSGDAEGRSGDLAHYTPGDHPSVWEINGVRCGALICYEYRFPELCRQYAGEGVQLVFHSFHAANASPERLAAIGAAIGPGLRRLNPAAMIAAAAANHMWISCPNSSAPESAWPAFFVRADGITVGRGRRNRPGVVISTVDTDEKLYHSTAAWRERALRGGLHSGTLVNDPRSSDRKAR
jgi:deaminated glutathione amidase